MSLAFLDGLNDQQRQAVTAEDGPLLVLAGAGSGKTRVIVYRIAYLIDRKGVLPGAILAVTFTNKATDEMRSRVNELLSRHGPSRPPGQTGGGVAIHTFHALCLRLLRRFGEDVSLRPGFTVYGADDRKALLRRVCREVNLSEREWSLSRVASAVSTHKLRGFSDKKVGDPRLRQALDVLVPRYQKELQAQGAVDFDDLLLLGVELMECSERAQSFAAQRFQHVLVDEYQDTNRIQYRLLRLLAPHGNVFVVGDEDQSIYNFRGADLRNILDFEADFPAAKAIKLEVNYRSSGAILKAASAVIENNRARKGKRLIPSLEEGERPELHAAEDEHEEAAFVARTIARARQSDETFQSAVLVRTHAQTRVFEEELVARGIPHRVLGGLRFYDRREIKDVLAYLRLALNPIDDAAFVRVVNVPQRGIGQATTTLIANAAASAGTSLWEASLSMLEGDVLPGRPRVGLTRFHEIVDMSRQAPGAKASSVMRLVLEKSGLLEDFEREGEATARERRENVEQLVAAAVELESRERADLASFLDSVSLLGAVDAPSGPAPCLLMTLHAAKGLEFDVVFLAGLEEGLFPHVRASGDVASLEEERRLFYVGMTRAKRRLFLSYARARRFAYQSSSRSPSRFLTEIPDDRLNMPSMPTAHRGRSSGEGRARGAEGPLRPGALVHHDKFGDGKVVDASGSGPDRKVTVVFWKAGRKRLVAQYAKLQIVG